MCSVIRITQCSTLTYKTDHMNLNYQNSSDQFYFSTKKFTAFFLSDYFKVYLIWLAIDCFFSFFNVPLQFCKKFEDCKKEKTTSTFGQLLGDAERDWRQSSFIPDFHLVFWYGLFWIVSLASSVHIMLLLCWSFWGSKHLYFH